MRPSTGTTTRTTTELESEAPTVRLVLKKQKKAKKVVWAEGTVDNEGMEKKSSKKCCIYHKPKAFGESSSESSSESDSCDHDH